MKTALKTPNHYPQEQGSPLEQQLKLLVAVPRTPDRVPLEFKRVNVLVQNWPSLLKDISQILELFPWVQKVQKYVTKTPSPQLIIGQKTMIW